jgi:hypothetical protein
LIEWSWRVTPLLSTVRLGGRDRAASEQAQMEKDDEFMDGFSVGLEILTKRSIFTHVRSNFVDRPRGRGETRFTSALQPRGTFSWQRLRFFLFLFLYILTCD